MLIRHPEVQGRRGAFGCGEKSGFVFVLAHPPVYVVRFRTCILADKSFSGEQGPA